MAQYPIDTNVITVTASRTAQEANESPASIAILEDPLLERLGNPQLADFLRLIPAAAVSTSGPMGSITEVRLRGAEANHVLLFIDGIRANDPAESNAPRFELLNPDLLSRIEVVRGPQSALWGSEAIGGVIAVEGRPETAPTGSIEGGAHGFLRAVGGLGMAGHSLDASFSAAFQRSSGINNLARIDNGERDGFRNRALRGRSSWRPVRGLELSASGFRLSGRSEFDGYDPITFNRADTLDFTRNRLTAARLGARYDSERKWKASGWVSRLDSSNRNYLGDIALNRTHGRRDTATGQAELELRTGSVDHRLIGAVEAEREQFQARDFSGGFSNQDRSRNHTALTAEWRTSVAGVLFTDLALRNDRFNRFKDATTLRASALVKPVKHLDIGISYGEGIAQPTFTELYGYFPGGFVGNPQLRPEHSRSLEVTGRLHFDKLAASLALYRDRLNDEIVTLFVPTNTSVNAVGRSKRKGAEATIAWRQSEMLNFSATYAYLDATQPTGLGNDAREVRRPRHSGSVAVDGSRGPWIYGGSIAYTGAHRDQRDEFPYELVQLSSYWLASARIAYIVRPGVQIFGRIANAFDERYQDVVGYRTEGRSAYAGLRLALDR
ncbi:MAG: TonB-dependent receptor [Sphingomicrobium sp.]